MKKYIYCPKCDTRLSLYYKETEDARAKQGFLTWCPMCEDGVTPITK